MNKRHLSVLYAGLLTIGLSTAAQAALIDHGAGLIYDDVLDVTWLQNANQANGPMSWDDAQTWVGNLSYQGYTNWRLPTISPINGSTYDMSISYDGTSDKGYSNSSAASELGYLFHVNLGYSSQYDGFSMPSNYGSDENSIFGSSLQADKYWSGSELSGTEALYFDMSDGYQGRSSKANSFYALAVHNGNLAPVPVPAAVWLFGSALVGLIGFGRTRK